LPNDEQNVIIQLSKSAQNQVIDVRLLLPHTSSCIKYGIMYTSTSVIQSARPLVLC